MAEITLWCLEIVKCEWREWPHSLSNLHRQLLTERKKFTAVVIRARDHDSPVSPTWPRESSSSSYSVPGAMNESSLLLSRRDWSSQSTTRKKCLSAVVDDHLWNAMKFGDSHSERGHFVQWWRGRQTHTVKSGGYFPRCAIADIIIISLSFRREVHCFENNPNNVVGECLNVWAKDCCDDTLLNVVDVCWWATVQTFLICRCWLMLLKPVISYAYRSSPMRHVHFWGSLYFTITTTTTTIVVNILKKDSLQHSLVA